MINNREAIKNTRDILDTLASCGINAWIQDGTLLGLVREGRIIPWDHDTDTGVFYSDWNDAAFDALTEEGFELTATLGSRTDGWQHRWTRNNVKTDIFFYYTNEDTTIWHAAYVQKTIQYRFTYPHFDTSPLRTAAGGFNAPDPPVNFLVTKYGADWKKPQRRWHFANSPLNGAKQS